MGVVEVSQVLLLVLVLMCPSVCPSVCVSDRGRELEPSHSLSLPDPV